MNYTNTTNTRDLLLACFLRNNLNCGGIGMNETFRKLACTTAELVGSPWAFMGGVGVIILWALSGPIFSFSDTWQLVVNTGTTIVTFLVVFLIQNAQNRDAKAIHLKLDE